MSKLKLTCKNCGKDVYKMPSEIRSKNVFCDRKCWSKYQEQLRRTEKCDCCGKKFTKRQSNFNGKHKICSECGHKDGKKTLDVREWTCPICHTQHDRDINASINILTEGLRIQSLA